MLSVPVNSFFYLLPVGAINSARLKVCNACCKSTVRTYEWVKEREGTLKAWRKKQLWLPLSPLQLQSQSQPASASISYFIFHTTFNANCAQLQLKLVTLFAPFLQFFLRFLLFLKVFFGNFVCAGKLRPQQQQRQRLRLHFGSSLERASLFPHTHSCYAK